MGIKLVSSSGGSVELNAPVTASNYTMTVPANNGTVITTASTFAGTGPAFSAVPGGSQTISNSTATKIQFPTEEFDTANCFDNVTNHRFIANLAGYYQVTGAINMTGSTGNNFIAIIYKNGSEFKRGNQSAVNSANNNGVIVPALIYLNGSTDYIELYGYQSAGGTVTVAGGYFQGVLVRAA